MDPAPGPPTTHSPRPPDLQTSRPETRPAPGAGQGTRAAWERALDEADTPGTRKVALRAAMVMSPDRGGVFDTLYGLVRRGRGPAEAGGRQFVSWIHDRDFAAAERSARMKSA